MGKFSVTRATGHLQGLPVTEKTYLFKELYIETIIRNPKKAGLFGDR